MKIYDDVLDKQFLEYINQTILNMNWQIHYSHPNQKTPLFFNSVILDENVKKEEFIFRFND